jgi:hypothetical protein
MSNEAHPEIPFEIHGYFEETVLPDGKAATWRINTVPKLLGVSGARQVAFKRGQTIMVNKGHKPDAPYTFKADCELTVMPQAICGRMLPRKVLA